MSRENVEVARHAYDAFLRSDWNTLSEQDAHTDS